MEVRVCKNCRRLFNYLFGPDLCPNCMHLVAEERMSSNNKTSYSMIKPLLHEDEVKYQQVRDYIMQYPRATVAEIAEVHGVSPSKIFDWVRDERLEFSEDSKHAWFECEICGEKIKSGRLCPRCKVSKK